MRATRVFADMARKKGCSPSIEVCFFLRGFGAINSTVFTVRELSMRAVQRWNSTQGRNDGDNEDGQQVSMLQELLVGANVGFWQSIVRTPVERIKSVMQIRNADVTRAPYRNSIVCAMDLIKELGLRAGCSLAFCPRS